MLTCKPCGGIMVSVVDKNGRRVWICASRIANPLVHAYLTNDEKDVKAGKLKPVPISPDMRPSVLENQNLPAFRRIW